MDAVGSGGKPPGDTWHSPPPVFGFQTALVRSEGGFGGSPPFFLLPGLKANPPWKLALWSGLLGFCPFVPAFLPAFLAAAAPAFAPAFAPELPAPCCPACAPC